MYKKQEVYDATLKYFKGNEMAAIVWMNKYCLKKKIVGTEDEFEYFELTPEDMHRRLAKELARIEAKYPNAMSEDEIFILLKDFAYIIPQGSPMAGIGNNFNLTSISNCFVIGDHVDSYGGIMAADEEQAQLMKRRGGVGQDISYIRPAGAMANGSPLGPGAGMQLYMDRYSNTTKEVQQDGRRGALMLSVDVKHPDSELFIDKKMTPGKVTGANVSVKISDTFMNAVRVNDSFYQTFPTKYDVGIIATDAQKACEIESERLYFGKKKDGEQAYFKRTDPNRIWKKIIHNAWKSAEPGILFWDKIRRESPANFYGEGWAESSTNPCGEIPLCPYDSCRLLAINLYSYLYKAFTDQAMLEDQLLIHHVRIAMRLMDDIVDLEIEKIDAIIEQVKKKRHNEKFQRVELEMWQKVREKAELGRRTGLGILGEADLIAGLGLRYGTPEATQFSEKLHQLIATAAYESSIDLAEERGAFPIHNSDDVFFSDFLKRMFEDNELMTEEYKMKHATIGRRNLGLLTIAPTGSTALLAQVASGIEPVFAPYSFRKMKVPEGEEYDYKDENGEFWIEFTVFHKPFIQWYATNYEIPFKGAEMELHSLDKASLEEIAKKSPYYKATAQDVDYIEKVRMQGAVQKWVDHSISVTVNMPEDVTEEIVSQVYFEAYKSGCKGITVYRENSRGNVLSTESIKNKEEAFEYMSAIKRPESVECDVFFRTAQKQEFIVFVGKVDGKPYEIFAVPYNNKTKISKRVKNGRIIKRGKGEYYFETDHGEVGQNVIENLCDHMIENEQNSTRLISGMLRHRVDPIFIYTILSKFTTISSFHKVIEKVISSYIAPEKLNNNLCPQCKETELHMTEGCMKCPGCGFEKCG